MQRKREAIWIGHVARMYEKRNAQRILIGNPEKKIPPRRPRHRWKYTNKDISKIG
jgi:hypothetical protein